MNLIKYKNRVRFRSVTLAEMILALALITTFIIISAPLLTVKAKLQGQDFSALMCIKNVLAANASEDISESGCASKPDNACCKAVKYCRYDQNNACTTLKYYAETGSSTEKLNSKKVLSTVCDQGGREGCKYFVVKCNEDNSTCNESGSNYDLQYYLNLPVSGSNASKGSIIDMAGNLYDEGAPNIEYWVNNTTSCPVVNLAYYIRGASCSSSGGTIGFPQMKLSASGRGTTGYKIRVDPNSGNIYMLGGYYWDHNGGSTLTDAYLVKMNSSGNIFFHKQIYSPSLGAVLYAHGLAIDGSGNVYVGISPFIPLSKYGGLGILKFQSDGTLLWQKNLKETAYNSGAVDLAVDNSNNVYIAGFDPSGNAAGDMLLAKMNSNGNLLMQKKINSSNNKIDNAYGVAVDSSYNIYLTGSSNNGSNVDIAFVKMNSSGNITLQKRINSSNNKADVANAIRLDSTASNAYLAGYTNSNLFTILKLSTSDGSITYQKVFGTADLGSPAHLTDIALDSSGNVYMVGHSTGANTELILLKMSSAGSLTSPNGWKLVLNNDSTSYINDYGMGIAIGPDGYIYVTGFISNSNIMSDQGGLCNSSSDAILLKMNTSQTSQESMFGSLTSPFTNITSPFNDPPPNANFVITSPYTTIYNETSTPNTPGYTFN